MSASHDAIVIGGGHNGLTCACYLAKAGMRVLVLEKHSSIGGMTNTEELTLPGFKSDSHAFGYQLANVSPAPAELELDRYGFELLRPEVCYSHAFPDGTSLSVFRDLTRSCEGIARLSAADAGAYQQLCLQFASGIEGFTAAINSPPQSPALELTSLEQAPDGLDAYRLQLQSYRAFARETFEDERTELLLGTWCCHVGLAPDDVGGAGAAVGFAGLVQQFGNNVVKGGMANLPRALAKVLRAHGGEIRTDTRVEKILIENRKAVAVRLSSKETIDAGELIASSVDPQQLILQLLGEQVVGPGMAGKLRRYEPGESALIVYLALDRPVHYRAGEAASRSVYVHPAPSLEFLSRQFVESRSGRLPAHPFALVCNESACDPTRAPDGRALIKLVVQPVPYVIAGDAAGEIDATTWDQAKEKFADRVIEQLDRDFIPGLRASIACRTVLSPVDQERILPSATRGTLMHGALLPYQSGAMRPIPELGNYRTPLGNVYLCGSGSHPGGGVSMAPGRNAAQVIYRDRSMNFPPG